ncbi:hypothetical protein [Breoghania sp.]|uniref:hypothetical protein n=1 Tax=Breoghania sp. TaxID=2065378 RepID=UPI00261DB7AE|nr:hypothetical protein [Breoghania sp.]MDJ0933566.1 hypothetical protein [Breoghania sp.]
MMFGTFWIRLGAAGLGAAIVLANLPILMLATAICGIGQGFGLQGAIQAVAHQSNAGQASKSISTFFLMSYGGTILSSVGVTGLISVSDLAIASTVFCAAIVALNLMTTDLLLRNRAAGYVTT